MTAAGPGDRLRLPAACHGSARLLPSRWYTSWSSPHTSIYLVPWTSRTVGDMGQVPDSLPLFLWPDVPLNLDTLLIVPHYSAALAVVGLLGR